MRIGEGFLTLIVELQGSHGEILRVAAQNRRAWERIQGGANDPLDWGALGFTLHSLYGVLEKYLLRVSKFFENDLPKERWHTTLLEKMSLEIRGVRPALLVDKGLRNQMRELLHFRRRFRNLYGEDLDPRKTAHVQAGMEELINTFSESHAQFLEKLQAIADTLE